MLQRFLRAFVFFILATTALSANPYMNTIKGEVRSEILGQENVEPLLGNEESPAVKVLTGMTNPEVLSVAHQYVRGEIQLDALEITKENHAQYIAAAKIIDLTLPVESQTNSTFQLRYKALKKSDPMMEAPHFTTAINAFSIPPADEQDPFLINQLDNRHLSLKQIDPKKLPEYRARIYEYSQKEARLHPEFLKVINKTVKTFARNIENLQTVISPPRIILYAGATGTGKSTAIKENIKNIDIDTYIASTDNLRKVISLDLNSDFDDSQLLHLAFSLRKEFEAAIKEKYGAPSLIQEAWMINADEIATALNNPLPIEVNDFDGDLRLLSLRTILRARSPGGRPTFPWDQMTRAFKLSRQFRPVIWKTLQSKDSYKLQYSYNDGTIQTYSLAEAQALFQTQLNGSADEEIKSVTQSVITKDDVAQIGEAIAEFEGMTISEAFQKAQVPVVLKQIPSKRFTILFTGDTHSHLEKMQTIAHTILLEKQRPENGEVAVVAVGDMMTGTEYFEISKGVLETELMNLAGYNIAALGNHELDAGWSHLKQVLAGATFDIVCANVYDLQTNQLIVEPYKIYSLGSLKVAFVGIMGTSAWNSIGPSSKKGLGIHDPDTVLDELLPKLESEADVIFLLSHSGIAIDRQYAAKHIQLDAILGGHSHTHMAEPELVQVTGVDKKIPVFHAFKNGDFLGKFTFEVSGDMKKHYTQLIKIDPSQEIQGPLTSEEEQIKSKMLVVNEQIEKIYSRVISTCIQPLSKVGIKNGVVPLGRDFICHILKEITQADATFYPSSGMRVGLEKGPITVRSIVTMLHQETLVTYKVSGAWLRWLMKEGELRWPLQAQSFQRKGIEINPATQEILVNGKPLQDERIYRVSGPSFFFERELLDSKGNLMEKHVGLVDPDFEEHPDELRTSVMDWLENNNLPPYIQRQAA